MNFQFSIFNFQFLVIFLLIFGLVLPSFCIAQKTGTAMPETIEEAKDFVMRVLKKLPDAVKEVWQKEAVPVWQRMWYWAQPKIESLWHKFLNLLGQEAEKIKPVIEKEFEKEKQEIKEELPIIGRGLWERFKDLIR